jgi:hypothetical protein
MKQSRLPGMFTRELLRKSLDDDGALTTMGGKVLDADHWQQWARDTLANPHASGMARERAQKILDGKAAA